MNNVIAETLAARIARAQMFERLGGLVIPQPVTIGGETKVLPIAGKLDGTPDVAAHFVPDTSRGPVGFFLEEAGAQFVSADGPKRGKITMAFSLRFLAWYNLGTSGLEGYTAAHIVMPRLMRELMNATEGESQRLNELSFANLEVLKISTLPQVPALFNAFSFYQDGLTKGLFAYPNDYFGLSVQGKYSVAIGGKCFNNEALPQIFGTCCN